MGRTPSEREAESLIVFCGGFGNSPLLITSLSYHITTIGQGKNFENASLFLTPVIIHCHLRHNVDVLVDFFAIDSRSTGSAQFLWLGLR